MPTKSTAAKSPKRQEQDTRADASAGPKGFALAPPAYGIDVVDRAPAGDGPLQLTPATDRRPEAAQAPAPRHARSTPPNNTGLPDGLKAGIESLSGISMDGVNVHYNSSRPAQLNALAYAQGRDIHVAPGQERHLPHEAWHLVQQAQGRVQPTMQLKDGVPVNDDEGLEHEADVMGARATVAGHLAPPSRYSQDGAAQHESHLEQEAERAADLVMAHEYDRLQTHVLPQRAGRVRNPFGSGIAVVRDAGLEAQAAGKGTPVAAQSMHIHERREGRRGRGVIQRVTATETELETGLICDKVTSIVHIDHNRTRRPGEPPGVQIQATPLTEPNQGIRHFIPYNWLRDICIAQVSAEGMGREAAYRWMHDLAAWLGTRAGHAYNAGWRRQEYDAQLDAVLSGICNWSGNLYRGDGYGDEGGELLDYPKDGRVVGEMHNNAAHLLGALGAMAPEPSRKFAATVWTWRDEITRFVQEELD